MLCQKVMNNVCMGTNIKQIRPISELEQHLFPVCTYLLLKMFLGLEQNSIKP